MSKVALYISVLNGGGAERGTLALAEQLVRRGHQVTLILERRSGALLGAVPDRVRILSLDAASSLRAAVPLTRLLAREQFDALISNLPFTNAVAAFAVSLLRGARPRLIAVYHNVFFEGETAWRKRILLLVATRLLRSAISHVVAVSRGAGDDVAWHIGLPPAAVEVVYNPVIDDGFAARVAADTPYHAAFSQSSPLILFVGRLEAQKDVPLLLAAFADVRAGRAAELVIAGEGAMMSSCKEQALALGIGAHVHFTGFVANPLPMMRRAAVVALTSRFEGLGNVLVEALACGTRVVSTDCPFGPREVLSDGRYGALVPVGDVTALSTALTTALDQRSPSAIPHAHLERFSAAFATDRYEAMILGRGVSRA